MIGRGGVGDQLLAPHVAKDRRHALAAGHELPAEGAGAVLLADLSGFTALTETLARVLGPRRGAERLTETLDRVLGLLIDEVHRVGGSVVYFSGDAITVWIEGDDGRRGVACADRMQQAMAGVARVEAEGETILLGLKVAVAAGSAKRYVVGDPDIQLVDVLAGAVLDQVATAESFASRGEVVVTHDVLAVLEQRALGADVHDDPHVAVLRRAAADDPAADDPAADDPAVAGDATGPPGDLSATTVPTVTAVSDGDAAPFVQRAVRGRLLGGDGALLAELRHVTAVFVDLGGIDLEVDDAATRLDGLLVGIQRVVARHEGALLTLTVGDKGAYTYAVFGTPYAHEDDEGRAVAAALAIRDAAMREGVDDVRIGVANGRVFSGVQGHRDRRTFVCIGDPVNLAARAMGAADPGEVLVVPSVVDVLGRDVVVRGRPPAMLKGRSEPIVLWAVEDLARGPTDRAGRDSSELRGREDALDGLVQHLSQGGRGRAAVVVGAAGIGKSRLVREAARRLAESGRRLLFGEAPGYGGTVPYQPWREMWRTLLDLPDDDRAAKLLLARLGAVDESLVDRAPLLGPVVGVDLPPTDLTSSMEPRVAKESREDLLVTVLEALGGPRLVLVLDDAHAADRLSIELAAAIARAWDRLDHDILLVGRPPLPDSPSLDELVDVEHVVRLSPLDRAATGEVLDHHARTRFGSTDSLHPAVREAVLERAQGNPLTVAELVRALVEQGVDPSRREAASVELPTSLEALVLGRVDRLPDLTRHIIKVGSVMQRAFGAETLTEVHPELGTVASVESALAMIHPELLAVRDDGTYEIRHALTREVSYSSLPFGLRRRLHRAVAARVARLHGEEAGPHVDELAHHSWFGEDDRREHWTRLAAERASGTYANDAALTYLDRLVAIARGESLIDALVDQGAVLTLVGRVDEAETVQRRALSLARAAGDFARRGRALAALAETARRASEFDDAIALLARAEEAFARVDDEAGRARVLHLSGTVSAMRGDLDAAGDSYREALTIRDRLGDDPGRASLMSNLGIVAEYDGNLEASAARHAQALALREQIGDPWAIANSRTNLGMIALLSGDPVAARGHFEQALRGNQAVGDPWHVALGRHNLANAQRDLGDRASATTNYVEAARHFQRADDDWALALLLEDVARLAVDTGRTDDGVAMVGRADEIRDRLDAPRTAAQAETITVLLAAAEAAVGVQRVRRALARGRDGHADRIVGTIDSLAVP